MRPMDIIKTTSGPTLIPGVSSSKNRSRPALAAGIGDSRLRLFSLADILHSHRVSGEWKN